MGISSAELARRVGVSRGAVSQWENGQVKGLSGENLVKVADELRLQINALTHGRSDRERVQGWPGITIDVFDVPASAGPGRVVEAHEQIIGSLSLSREWVRGHLPSLTAHNNLAVISAFGDSMAPTFSDGDILLVDRGVRDAKMDAVFVIGRGDELLVKRIQRRLSGDLVIRSDNPLFESETVAGVDLENLRILGRVVYAWNGKRL